jgi:hypothetical protein
MNAVFEDGGFLDVEFRLDFNVCARLQLNFECLRHYTRALRLARVADFGESFKCTQTVTTDINISNGKYQIF